MYLVVSNWHGYDACQKKFVVQKRAGHNFVKYKTEYKPIYIINIERHPRGWKIE